MDSNQKFNIGDTFVKEEKYSDGSSGDCVLCGVCGVIKTYSGFYYEVFAASPKTPTNMNDRFVERPTKVIYSEERLQSNSFKLVVSETVNHNCN